VTSRAVAAALMLASVLAATAGCAAGGRLWRPTPAPEPAGARAPAAAAPSGGGGAPAAAAVPPPAPDPLARLQARLDVLEARLATLEAALNTLAAGQQHAAARLLDVERRLAQPAPPPAAARAAPPPPALAPPPPVPPPAPAPAARMAPEDLHRAAQERLQAGEEDAGVLLLYELVSTHPRHPLREVAQLQVADLLYAQRNFRAALAEYESLLESAPAAPRAAAALLGAGLCHRELGDGDRARAAWERLVRQFPATDPGRRARQLLDAR
jgi:TolA-binding protein